MLHPRLRLGARTAPALSGCSSRGPWRLSVSVSAGTEAARPSLLAGSYADPCIPVHANLHLSCTATCGTARCGMQAYLRICRYCGCKPVTRRSLSLRSLCWRWTNTGGDINELRQRCRGTRAQLPGQPRSADDVLCNLQCAVSRRPCPGSCLPYNDGTAAKASVSAECLSDWRIYDSPFRCLDTNLPLCRRHCPYCGAE